MEIFAAFMFMGTLTSFLIPETKRKTLEELAGEAGGAEADRLSGGGTTERKKERRGQWLLGRGHGRAESRDMRDTTDTTDTTGTRYEASLTSDGINTVDDRGEGKRPIGWKYGGWSPDNIPLQDVGGLMR